MTDGTTAPTASRKLQHLQLNLGADVSAKGVDNGFADYRFAHLALPDIDMAEVRTDTAVLGWRLGAPLLISCMTGGVEEARRINTTLAAVAQRFGLPLGLGSGRVLLEHPEALPSFEVRGIAPDVPLLANLGAVQLNRGVGVDDCARLVATLGADALVLHLNALQEALQPEGDTCFRGLLARIAEVAALLDVPVIVKEVGWGLSGDVVAMLLDAGVAAVDVAGAGGTSWSEVERHRLGGGWRARVAAAFAGWGIPTATAVRAARAAAPHAVVIASGGIRDGGESALALALGADLVGIAGPFLRAADAGEEAAADLAREVIEVLRVTMFCVGARTVDELRRSTRLLHRGVPLAGADAAVLPQTTGSDADGARTRLTDATGVGAGAGAHNGAATDAAILTTGRAAG